MQRRLYPPLCAGLVVAGLALLPSAAPAQMTDPGAPEVGTPPANQYEIPLQAGRRDAAPSNAKRDPRSGSLYRTDNNFGSSSIIPGDPRDGGTGGSGGAGGTGEGAGAGAGAGAASEGTVGGSGSSGPDELDTGAPSELAAYTTLPLIVLLGVVIGVAGVRMRRRAEL